MTSEKISPQNALKLHLLCGVCHPDGDPTPAEGNKYIRPAVYLYRPSDGSYPFYRCEEHKLLEVE